MKVIQIRPVLSDKARETLVLSRNLLRVPTNIREELFKAFENLIPTNERETDLLEFVRHTNATFAYDAMRESEVNSTEVFMLNSAGE
jgi:hypothetical protein